MMVVQYFAGAGRDALLNDAEIGAFQEAPAVANLAPTVVLGGFDVFDHGPSSIASDAGDAAYRFLQLCGRLGAQAMTEARKLDRWDWAVCGGLSLVYLALLQSTVHDLGYARDE